MSRASRRNTKSRAIQRQQAVDRRTEAKTRWTRRREREFSHACAADHPKSPGFRNYLALPPGDADAISLEAKGLAVRTGERDGMVCLRVAEGWRKALVGQREGHRYVDLDELNERYEAAERLHEDEDA